VKVNGHAFWCALHGRVIHANSATGWGNHQKLLERGGMSRLSGVGALWACVPHVCGGGGGCAGGGVPLEAVPVLSWCGEVSLGSKQS